MSKALLVTGGSRGIGRATALLAAQQGWSIGINYVGNEAAALEAVQVVQVAGGQAMALRGDVSVESDVIAMFDGMEKRFGALDYLVNNAGIVAPQSQLADMDLDRLQRMFSVNVLGVYLCAREAARRLSTKGGAIVNLSSGAARRGAPGEYVDYAGSKGAVESLTIGLGRELAPEGVRVNAVRPGFIDTEIHASGGRSERGLQLGATTPMGRVGRAEEVAAAILWLLSDAASYTTGTIVDVTGGL